MHCYENCHHADSYDHGSLARYVKLRVAFAPGMPGTFSPPPWVSDPDMHHGTCVTHVPWCMPVPLTGGFVWSWWRGKRSRHPRRMRNQQFYISGKRPMALTIYASSGLYSIPTFPFLEINGLRNCFVQILYLDFTCAVEARLLNP